MYRWLLDPVEAATSASAGRIKPSQRRRPDAGWTWKLEKSVDSSAAVAVATRCGLGKFRHLEAQFLWLQKAVKVARMTVAKVRGLANPAGMLTKPQSASDTF